MHVDDFPKYTLDCFISAFYEPVGLRVVCSVALVDYDVVLG